jgi:hypothetical protein
MKREGTTSQAGGRAAAGAGAGLGAAAASEAAARAAALKRKAPGLGAVTDRELQMLKKAAPKIKLPANPNKPLVRQNAIIRTTTNMKPTPTAKKR